MYYCVDKTARRLLSSGPLPLSWRNIQYPAGLHPQQLKELDWAGHPGIAFLTREEAAQYLDPKVFATDDAEHLREQVNNIKDLIKSELRLTDWVELPSVRNGSPRLVNAAAFDEYRSKIRLMMVNNTNVPVLPPKPAPIWER